MNNGKAGELLFKTIMEDKGYKVEAASIEEQLKDIDFILTSPTTGLVKTFEVKWDSAISYTNNLFLETYNPRSKQWNCDGWWYHCEADYIAYGDEVNKRFYVIDFRKLQQRVRALQLRTGRTADGAKGLLLPLGLIDDLVSYL